MKITDELLMAYADGELDAETRAQVADAVACDPDLARQVAAHRALRETVAGAYAGALEEPVPDRLLAAVTRPPASAQVVDLASVRRAKTPPAARTWSWPQWGAMAACLVAGLIVGQRFVAPGAQPLIGETGGAMVARGSLAQALTTQLASNAQVFQPIRIGLSFRSTDRTYCRTFQVASGGGLAGVACRDKDSWRIRIATATGASAASGGYRMAGSQTPPAILAAVQDMISGEPLDAKAEASAKAKGWRE